MRRQALSCLLALWVSASTKRLLLLFAFYKKWAICLFIDLPSSFYSLETNVCQLYVLQVYSSGLSMACLFPLRCLLLH